MAEPIAVIITIEPRAGRDETAAYEHGFKELKSALGVLNHSSPWAVFAIAQDEDEYFDENVDEVAADAAVEDGLDDDSTDDEAGDSTPDPDLTDRDGDAEDDGDDAEESADS